MTLFAIGCVDSVRLLEKPFCWFLPQHNVLLCKFEIELVSSLHKDPVNHIVPEGMGVWVRTCQNRMKT